MSVCPPTTKMALLLSHTSRLCPCLCALARVCFLWKWMSSVFSGLSSHLCCAFKDTAFLQLHLLSLPFSDMLFQGQLEPQIIVCTVNSLNFSFWEYLIINFYSIPSGSQHKTHLLTKSALPMWENKAESWDYIHPCEKSIVHDIRKPTVVVL